jgi:hypothetical protein
MKSTVAVADPRRGHLLQPRPERLLTRPAASISHRGAADAQGPAGLSLRHLIRRLRPLHDRSPKRRPHHFFLSAS